MLAISTRQPGVMDATYARERVAKAHLAFRLRVRAQVVAGVVRRFAPSLPVRLLDVGAAEGQTLLEIATSLGAGKYVGVENDEALLHAHPPFPANLTLIAGDALSLPAELGESRFDVVSLLAVLEHLPDPLAALHEARRVLRPGGLVVATCPSPFWDAAAGRLGLVDDSHHVEQIDENRLRGLVETAGFDIVEARQFMWAPVAILSYARIPVPPHLALALDTLINRIPFLRGLCVNAYVVGRRPADCRAVALWGRLSSRSLCGTDFPVGRGNRRSIHEQGRS